MPRHEFRLEPSRSLILLNALLILATMILVLFLPVSWAIRLPGSLLLLIYGLHVCWSNTCLKGKNAILALREAEGRFELVMKNNTRVMASLQGSSVVTGLICILHFRAHRQFACVIVRDMLSREEYRRLLVVLRTGS